MAKKQDGYQPPADKKMRGPKGRGSKFGSAYSNPKGKTQEWPWDLNSSKGKKSSSSSSSSKKPASKGGLKKSGPTTPGKNSITYVIKSGDTLGAIAKKHGVSLSDLTRVNNIKDANKIIAGKSIRIPKTATGRWSGMADTGGPGWSPSSKPKKPKAKLTKKTTVTKKPKSKTVTKKTTYTKPEPGNWSGIPEKEGSRWAPAVEPEYVEQPESGREGWPVGPMSGGGIAGPGMTPGINWNPAWSQSSGTYVPPPPMPNGIIENPVVPEWGGEGSQASEPDIYVVQAGDTLGTIADKLGVHYMDIAEMNQLDNPNIINPGQVLRLPLPPGGRHIPEAQGQPSARVAAAAPYYMNGRYVGKHNPMPPAMTPAGMSLPGAEEVQSTILARKNGGKLLRSSDVNSMFS